MSSAAHNIGLSIIKSVRIDAASGISDRLNSNIAIGPPFINQMLRLPQEKCKQHGKKKPAESGIADHYKVYNHGDCNVKINQPLIGEYFSDFSKRLQDIQAYAYKRKQQK